MHVNYPYPVPTSIHFALLGSDLVQIVNDSFFSTDINHVAGKSDSTNLEFFRQKHRHVYKSLTLYVNLYHHIQVMVAELLGFSVKLIGSPQV